MFQSNLMSKIREVIFRLTEVHLHPLNFSPDRDIGPGNSIDNGLPVTRVQPSILELYDFKRLVIFLRECFYFCHIFLLSSLNTIFPAINLASLFLSSYLGRLIFPPPIHFWISAHNPHQISHPIPLQNILLTAAPPLKRPFPP